MDTESFRYRPLDPKGAFRLLRLKKGTGRDVECELTHAVLGDEENQYEAVSYTWGPNPKKTADTISIHGQTLRITLNLSLILRDLRSPVTDRTLWIDAICINQGDDRERGYQVQQMKDIFKSARRVLICVCRPTESTDLLMTSLQGLQIEKASKDPRPSYNWPLDNSHLLLAWENIQTELRIEHFALEERQREGLEHILNQAWFSRVWILQEVANARDASVYCGKKYIPACIFAISPYLLKIHQPQDQRYQPVLELMPGPWRKNNYDQDLYSLLKRFSSAQATVERDKIYALFGMCTDITSNTSLRTDYIKPVENVVCDTVSHIYSCDPLSKTPYTSIVDFLNDLESLDNKMLLQFLRLSDTEKSLTLLQRRGNHVNVVMEMIELVANNEMQTKGVTELLLNLRGTENIVSNRENAWTPLWWAAENGHEDTVKILLDKGADTEASDKNGRTPLSWAAGHGHEAVVKLLVEKGADFKSKDNRGRTPLVCAAWKGYGAPAELLLDKGADIEASDQDGKTPLLGAAENGHEVTVKLLLDNGANIEAHDRHDRTPLLWAASNNHEATLKLLLDKGANVEAHDTDGRTPLLWAASFADEAIVKLLIDKGADTEASDKDGRTPLSWAAGRGREAAVKLLVNKGADVESKDNHGRAPLIYAAWEGHDTPTELLLNKGADIEVSDKAGRTPLLWAVTHGHDVTVKLLIDKGADVETKDKHGRTPLEWATERIRNGWAKHGHEAAMELLHARQSTGH